MDSSLLSHLPLPSRPLVLNRPAAQEWSQSVDAVLTTAFPQPTEDTCACVLAHRLGVPLLHVRDLLLLDLPPALPQVRRTMHAPLHARWGAKAFGGSADSFALHGRCTCGAMSWQTSPSCCPSRGVKPVDGEPWSGAPPMYVGRPHSMQARAV